MLAAARKTKAVNQAMSKFNQYMILSFGCVIFMMLGVACWYVLDLFIEFESLYFVAALVNAIGFVGHGVTVKVIRMMSGKTQRGGG